MYTRWFKIALPLLALMALVGIFFAGRESEYGEIEGRVTRNGVPLDQVEVVFYPEVKGLQSSGQTNKDGYFEIATPAIQERPSRKGAPLGKYRVVLLDRSQFGIPSLQAAQDGKNAAPHSSAGRIPASFGKRLDTPLVDIEIKPGKNAFEFEVQ